MNTTTSYMNDFLDLVATIPIAQLFIAGVFAVIMTELIKYVIDVKESSIGIHRRNGDLISAKMATLLYTSIILFSNVLSYITYTQASEYVLIYITERIIVDFAFVFISILTVWFYLKLTNYSRN